MKLIKTILVIVFVFVTINTFVSCTDSSEEENSLINEKNIEKDEIKEGDVFNQESLYNFVDPKDVKPPTNG